MEELSAFNRKYSIPNNTWNESVGVNKWVFLLFSSYYSSLKTTRNPHFKCRLSKKKAEKGKRIYLFFTRFVLFVIALFDSSSQQTINEKKKNGGWAQRVNWIKRDRKYSLFSLFLHFFEDICIFVLSKITGNWSTYRTFDLRFSSNFISNFNLCVKKEITKGKVSASQDSKKTERALSDYFSIFSIENNFLDFKQSKSLSFFKEIS